MSDNWEFTPRFRDKLVLKALAERDEKIVALQLQREQARNSELNALEAYRRVEIKCNVLQAKLEKAKNAIIDAMTYEITPAGTWNILRKALNELEE